MLKDSAEAKSKSRQNGVYGPNVCAKLTSLVIFFLSALGQSVMPALAQDSGSLKPGEAFVTRFSGTQGEGSGARIDQDGTVGSIVDLRAPSQAPAGQHWLNEPQRAPVTARQVGQVFGVAIETGSKPHIYLTATSAFGLHLSDGRNWMPGMWGEGGGPGTVYRLDADKNYAPEVFATITLDGRRNTGAALGNVAFDPVNRQLFVSDLETGMIHRLSAADGKELGRYDHGVSGRPNFYDSATGASGALPAVPFDASSAARISDCPGGDFARTPACWNVADFRRRVWGLGVRQDPVTGEVRLYYSLWSNEALGSEGFEGADADERRNAIWSVGLKEDGGFDTSTVVREFFLPDFANDRNDGGNSSPVSDISFPKCSDQNVMLLSERGGLVNLSLGVENAFARPHESRVLRYAAEEDGTWSREGRYPVGHYARADRADPKIRANASGGADFGYGYSSRWQADPSKPDQSVWMTGDALCAPFAPCFNPATGRHSDGSQVHGIEGIDAGGFRPAGEASAETATTPLPAWMVDTDLNIDGANQPVMSSLTRNDATRIGDIAIYQPCDAEEGAAAPPVEGEVVEPPVEEAEPPVDEGAPPVEEPLPDLEKSKTGPAECLEGDICTFTVTVTNNGPGVWSGPLLEHDDLPPGSTLVDYGPQPDWLCAQAGDGVDCEHADVTLAAGDQVTLTLDVQLPPGLVGDVENCIFDVWQPEGPNDDPDVIRTIEERLNALGFAPGPIDGILDPQTQTAITDFQNANGLVATGDVTDELREALFPGMAGLPGDGNPDNDSDCHVVNVIPQQPPPQQPPPQQPPPQQPPPIGPAGQPVPGTPPGGTRVAQCNDTVRQGGDQPEAIEIDLGGRQGQASIDWDMLSVKDQMRVFVDGALVHDTQCVSGTGSQPFSVPPGAQRIRVEVNPNCDGTTGTIWDFTVLCPPEPAAPERFVVSPAPPPVIVAVPPAPPIIVDVPVIRTWCPPGTILRHGRCVKITRRCPPGTILRHGRCIEVARHCPPGTIRRHGRCVRISRDCPPGTILRHGRCIKVARHCPPGTIRRHGRCVKVERHCPPGTIRRHGRCVKIERHCPEGTVRRGGRCVRIGKPHTHACPPGTVRRANRCVRIHKEGHSRQCPPGTVRRGNRCVHKGKAATTHCPPGMVRKGNRCVRIQGRVVKRCPPGTRRSGNQCVRIVKKGRPGVHGPKRGVRKPNIRKGGGKQRIRRPGAGKKRH